MICLKKRTKIRSVAKSWYKTNNIQTRQCARQKTYTLCPYIFNFILHDTFAGQTCCNSYQKKKKLFKWFYSCHKKNRICRWLDSINWRKITESGNFTSSLNDECKIQNDTQIVPRNWNTFLEVKSIESDQEINQIL